MTVERVCRALQKKPHTRSNLDLHRLCRETEGFSQLLCELGPSVHRDLCHVVSATLTLLR